MTLRLRSAALSLALAALTSAAPTLVRAQEAEEPRAASAAPTGPIVTDHYHATFVRLGSDRADGLLFEPNAPGAKSRIAVVFTFPRATFGAPAGPDLATRGYRVLLVTPYTEDESPFDGIAETSAAVRYARSLPGVEKVVVMSHSGGGRMMAFYAALAEKGPAACQGPTMIHPCKTEQTTGIAKADGLVLLDPAPGGFNTASAMDPAYLGVTGKRSRAALDMYAAANGFNAKTGAATYSSAFLKRFYAAQSARNNAAVAEALAKLKAAESGKGSFKGDEPFLVPGAVNGGNGASPYHADLSLLSHTKRPHILVRGDGSQTETILRSVRPTTSAADVKNLDTLCCATLNYSVRHFLENDAIRTTPQFAVTADDIVGIDWRSGMRTTPGSAESITVPSLILTMTCFHFVVPGEIVFDHLAAKDKTYAAVEGATHNFTPCKPQYGNTRKATFDFVDAWLSKPGRF
ncbi:hypothetical protein H7F51_11295 [Novosphingobium flavum]|uniref:Alpha/beta hydrolase n=1 Tax=Novosphingobium flavum TaxID=1778672 RepID=A0A7X1KLZ8_9SPHN|nr:hypothetical protein [Novosphingobium flavum]MBC2666102.1 hypothetical protein [Novosphingobium flavum]